MIFARGNGRARVVPGTQSGEANGQQHGLILGILPQVAALVIMGSMVGSMSFHIFKWKSTYWAASGGWEYHLMIFTMASIVLVSGGGDLAVYPTF